jgi:hypothetical protein
MGAGIGKGMNEREWERMGMKNYFALISNTGMAEQRKQTFSARSTYYNETYLYLLIRSNLLTSVLKIAEGRNFGRYQIMRLGMVELQGPLAHVFNFWAKQHGIVSFK